ncbi:WD40 repeat domain-containing protein [Rufibacter psychrotolerans]|uniref:WD40 repeat domain-containing protein n=1 Tax=Rufibacter psychrotolerans TaxID=2812556 RepID=UPI0019688798|nr:hypothetical protein [Rufibacter sp. SYSU D00308]
MINRKGLFLLANLVLASSLSFSQTRFKALTLLKHEEDLKFQDVAFSPEGNQLVSVGNQGMLYLWDVGQSYPVDFKQVHKGPALACTYSTDGRYVVTGGEDKTIRIFQTIGLAEVKSIGGLPAPVKELALAGNRMVALLQNNEIRLYNTDTWEQVGKPRVAAHDSRIVFSSTGDRFYAWFSSRVYIISAKDGELIQMFNTNYGTPQDLAVSPDNAYLAVGFDKTAEIVRIYSTKNLKLVKAVKKNGSADQATGLTFFNTSNKLLYYSRAANSNKIFDLEKGTNTAVLKSGPGARASISKDDSKVALTAKTNNAIQVLTVH